MRDKNKKEQEEIAISGRQSLIRVHTYGELIGILRNNKEFNRY